LIFGYENQPLSNKDQLLRRKQTIAPKTKAKEETKQGKLSSVFLQPYFW
jgi:hypothetical protein